MFRPRACARVYARAGAHVRERKYVGFPSNLSKMKIEWGKLMKSWALVVEGWDFTGFHTFPKMEGFIRW